MRRTTRRYDDMSGVLCCGTMLWRQHPVSDTAWLRHARTRVLWHDVDHHAARRDEV